MPLPLPPPEALFFDAAGTLIDLAEPVSEVYARHFTQAGFPSKGPELAAPLQATFQELAPPDYAAHEPGDHAERRWWRALVTDVFLRTHEKHAGALKTTDFDTLFEGLFSHYARAEAWTVFPDVLPTLEAAKGQARLAVISNFDDRLRPIMEGLGLAPYFETIISSSAARARKPDSAIFHHALAEMGLAADQAAHVGDSPRADLAGAQNCGIRAFLVTRPASGLPEFLNFCGLNPN